MSKSLATSSLVEILFRATENIGSWCWHVSLSCSAAVSCGMHAYTHPTLHQGTGIFCMPLFTPAVLLGNWKSQCLLHYNVFTLQKNVLYFKCISQWHIIFYHSKMLLFCQQFKGRKWKLRLLLWFFSFCLSKPIHQESCTKKSGFSALIDSQEGMKYMYSVQ